MPAPKGNKHATKARIWSAALERALERRVESTGGIKALDKLADVFIENCFTGDLGFLKEFGDRMEGRSRQQIDITSDEMPTVSPGLTFEVARRIIFVLEQSARAKQLPSGGALEQTQH